MKNTLYILMIALSFTACKNDAKQEKTVTETTTEVVETTKQLTLYEGDFVYYGDAAVLQTKQGIFGVILNETAKTLAEKAKAFQKEPTDMVKVRVGALLEPKAEGTEGWDFNVNIKDILKVEALNPKENEIIKIEK